MTGPTDRIAFADIDTQFDFIDPQGKLYAPGAEAIRENLGRLVRHARDHAIPLISSIDAHGDDDAEFDQFPPHCLKGSEGAAKIPETRTGAETFVENVDRDIHELPDPRATHVVVEKQQFPIFTNPVAEKLFAKTGAGTVVVFGVVTEVCVRFAVLGLLERGYAVRLVTDAIWPITEAYGDAAIREMSAAGATLTTTAEVLALSPARA